MRNRFAGICYRCGENVAPGEGHFEQAGRDHSGKMRWRTQHADCAIIWRGKAFKPATENARMARIEYQATGQIPEWTRP